MADRYAIVTADEVEDVDIHDYRSFVLTLRVCSSLLSHVVRVFEGGS